MYAVKMPRWINWLPGLYRPKPSSASGVFLSFDDGPHPGTTPWLLDLLEQYHAKATFFYPGKQAEHFPELVTEVRKSGHSIGNHTYSHLNGWLTNREAYIKDIERAAASTSDNLFRPPYGKISPQQLAGVGQKGYKTVLWDIMPGDFDEKVSADTCLERILHHLSAGTIIVLHENDRSEEKLRYIMPKLLEHMKANNFVAEKIVI